MKLWKSCFCHFRKTYVIEFHTGMLLGFRLCLGEEDFCYEIILLNALLVKLYIAFYSWKKISGWGFFEVLVHLLLIQSSIWNCILLTKLVLLYIGQIWAFNCWISLLQTKDVHERWFYFVQEIKKCNSYHSLPHIYFLDEPLSPWDFPVFWWNRAFLSQF